MLDFPAYIVYNDFVHLMVKSLVLREGFCKTFYKFFTAFLLLFIADGLKAGTFAPQSLFY